MGWLHEGHTSLIGRARADSATVVVSIFVNPRQFGETTDFTKYPRNEARDLAICEAAGVDLVFAPPVDEVYVPGFDTTVTIGAIAEPLEGAARPGHFDGVATVVAILFSLVGAERAYFGLKDYQQVRVIRRMALDLALPTEVVALDTVREPDGLALSSRNARLSPVGRAAAPVSGAHCWRASRACAAASATPTPSAPRSPASSPRSRSPIRTTSRSPTPTRSRSWRRSATRRPAVDGGADRGRPPDRQRTRGLAARTVRRGRERSAAAAASVRYPGGSRCDRARRRVDVHRPDGTGSFRVRRRSDPEANQRVAPPRQRRDHPTRIVPEARPGPAVGRRPGQPDRRPSRRTSGADVETPDRQPSGRDLDRGRREDVRQRTFPAPGRAIDRCPEAEPVPLRAGNDRQWRAGPGHGCRAVCPRGIKGVDLPPTTEGGSAMDGDRCLPDATRRGERHELPIHRDEANHRPGQSA